MQLNAGAISSALFSRLRLQEDDLTNISSLIRRLCAFECISEPRKGEIESQTCAILDNILSRGAPTLCSPYVERVLAQRLSLTEAAPSAATIEYQLKPDFEDQELISLLNAAVAVIDPRVRPSSISKTSHDSDHETRFLHDVLPQVVGDWSAQMLEPQRSADSILLSGFEDQRLDFAIQYSSGYGAIIEIDDHEEAQKLLDKARDEAAEELGWETLRIENDELSMLPESKVTALRNIFGRNEFGAYAENYDSPFWLDPKKRLAYSLVLVPFLVARIQKTLVWLIRKGVLSLDSPKWTIEIRERDIPCAWIAVEDFTQLLTNILSLKGDARKPEIELRVQSSEEMLNTELSHPDRDLHYHYETGEDEIKLPPDCILDVSILQHSESGVKNLESAKIHSGCSVVFIRSSYSTRIEHCVSSAKPIAYRINPERDEKTLIYLLQFLFRKRRFLEKQMNIINRALARKDVIGLLPTGAGKSLCYQMAALLQPGITVIVDPLKTLMFDQVQQLKAAGIDTVSFINSQLKGARRKEVVQRFRRGNYQFVFIAPERFLSEQFRIALGQMTMGSRPVTFAYCVVDEAHCVSEWGHDFRTPYLRLGTNIRQFLSPHNGTVPIIALTGTASFDVLSDVQRELGVDDPDSVEQLDSFEREELKFEVHSIKLEEGSGNKIASAAKKDAVLQLLQSMPAKLGSDLALEEFFCTQGSNTNLAIVFCPHVGGVFGIKTIATYLRQAIPSIPDGGIRVFAGKLQSDPGYGLEYLEQTQRDFRENKFAILVSTKAFGMGIDMPNVRSIIHFNIPSSIEAYYQEAGRAGRDHEDAICSLLYSDGYDDRSIPEYFHDISFPGAQEEKDILYNRFLKTDVSSCAIEELLDSMSVGEIKRINIEFANSRRNRQQTEKAIYRLSLVGVVGDYTADYNKKLFNVQICRRSDAEYINVLLSYVSRFMSREETTAVPSDIRARRGQSVTQKCLSYLISFVYDRIQERRKQAIESMEQASILGAFPNKDLQKDRAQCREDFRSYVMSYFDSRYTPDLRRFMYEYDSSLVVRYLKEIGGDPDSAKHLLGSCRRLREENPRNAALLVLQGFAELVLGYNEGFQDRILSGLSHFEQQEGREAACGLAALLTRTIEKLDKTRLSGIYQVIVAQHVDWLERFNRQLKGGDIDA